MYGLDMNENKLNGEPPIRDVSGRPLEVTHVRHGIDLKHWPASPNAAEKKELAAVEHLPNDYIVTVGKISHVKGTWETMHSLTNTGLAMVQIGGGDAEDRKDLIQEGKRIGVPVICMPRLSQPAMCGVIRGARAMVSHAYHEPFGLTPIEAMAVGTPALMVDEGGFNCTLSRVDSGRLLSRDDAAGWKNAYLDAKDPVLRQAWAKAGRAYVEEYFHPDVEIAALERMLLS